MKHHASNIELIIIRWYQLLFWGLPYRYYMRYYKNVNPLVLLKHNAKLSGEQPPSRRRRRVASPLQRLVRRKPIYIRYCFYKTSIFIVLNFSLFCFCIMGQLHRILQDTIISAILGEFVTVGFTKKYETNYNYFSRIY